MWALPPIPKLGENGWLCVLPNKLFQDLLERLNAVVMQNPREFHNHDLYMSWNVVVMNPN